MRVNARPRSFHKPTELEDILQGDRPTRVFFSDLASTRPQGDRPTRVFFSHLASTRPLGDRPTWVSFSHLASTKGRRVTGRQGFSSVIWPAPRAAVTEDKRR